MDVKQWSVLLTSWVKRIFPKKMSPSDRLLAVIRQVADASGALHKQNGVIKSGKHEHEDLKHRVACCFIDLFVLCEDLNVDLEKEWQKAVEWFKSQQQQR